MSKNTANIAQAISLLSDVLSREATCELNEDIETEDNDEYDDLKEQALEFGREVSDELSVISDDLELILDLDDEDDDDNSWNPLEDYDDDVNDEDEDDLGNGDVDITNTESDDDGDADDDDESEPTDAAKVQMLMVDGAILEEKNAELEKNKLELSDMVEDITDTLRGVVTLIESLESTADAFVNEVDAL